MSVNLTTTPPLLAFSADLISAKLTSTSFLSQNGTKSINRIDFTDFNYTSGEQIEIKYGSVVIAMVAQTVPDDSGTSFKAGASSVQEVATGFKNNFRLNADFDITVSGNYLVFTSKIKSDQFDFTSGGSNTTPGKPDIVKPNYAISVRLFCENAANSAFELIHEAGISINQNGIAEYPLGDKLHNYISNDIRNLSPDIPDSSVIQCKKCCRRYYIEYAERYGDEVLEKKVNTSTQFTILHGGLSHRAQFQQSLLDLIAPGTRDHDRFLKQGNTEVYTRTNQPQYLYFFNTRAVVASAILKVKIYYKGGTSETINKYSFNMATLRKYAFDVRFDNLPVDANKVVEKYEAWLASGSTTISEKRVYHLNYQLRNYVRYFLNWSSWGSLDSRLCYGKGNTEFEILQKEAKKILKKGFDIKQGDTLVFDVKLKSNFSVATGWMNKTELIGNRDFYLSPIKYRYVGGLLMPIMVTSKTITEIEDGNNLYAQQYEYRYLYDDHAYTEGDIEEPGLGFGDFFFSSNPIGGNPTGGLTEVDPTVPIWVKQITQIDIDRWNSIMSIGDDFYSKSDIDQKFDDEDLQSVTDRGSATTKTITAAGLKAVKILSLPTVPPEPGMLANGEAAMYIGNLSGFQDDPGGGESPLSFTSPLSRTGNTVSIDLSSYASKTYVTSQGFLKSADLSGYAQQSWVTGQLANYLKKSDADGFYVLKSGDTMTGPLTAPSLKATEKLVVPTAPSTFLNGEAGLYIGDLSGIEDTPGGGESPLTFTSPLSRTGNTVSIDLSSYASKTYVNSQGFLKSGDLSSYAQQSWVTGQLSGYVPKTRTVNGKSLSTDIALSASDVGALDKTIADVFYVLKSGDTMTGPLTAPTLKATAKLVVPTTAATFENGEAGLYIGDLSGIEDTPGGGESPLSFVSPLSRTGNSVSIDLSGYATQAWVGLSYEPKFTKNSAFNKNFGSSAGTVAQGNDSRINNGQTAYGWGNHANAGYVKLANSNWVSDSNGNTRIFVTDLTDETDFILKLGRPTGRFSWRPSDSHVPIASLDYAGNLAVASNLTANTGNIGDVRIGATGMIYPNLGTNVAAGMYGNYVSTRVGHIWSMGTAFKIADNGSGLGNLYGLAYRYKETGGGGGKDLGHSILFVGNGAVSTQIGLINGHIWTAGNVYVDLSVAASVKVSAPTIQATDKLLIPTATSSFSSGEAGLYIGDLSGIQDTPGGGESPLTFASPLIRTGNNVSISPSAYTYSVVPNSHIYKNGSNQFYVKLSVGSWLTDGQDRNRIYTNNTNPSSDFIFNLGQSNGLFSWRPYNSSTPIASLDYAGNLNINGNLKIANEHFHYPVYNYTAGHLVQTDIPASLNIMFTLSIYGNSYASTVPPIDTKVQGYNYAAGGSILNVTALVNGWNFGEIQVFLYGGYICFWLPGGLSKTLKFGLVTQAGDYRITSVSNVANPTTGVTNRVTATRHVSYNSENHRSDGQNDSRYALATRQVIAGDHLFGGGSFAADRNIRVRLNTGTYVYDDEGSPRLYFANTTTSTGTLLRNSAANQTWEFRGPSNNVVWKFGATGSLEIGAIPWDKISGGSVSSITGAGSTTSHGSVTITGSKGGYSGIYFPDAGYRFMIGNATGNSGLYDGSAWKWQFNFEGALVAGTIPLDRLPEMSAQRLLGRGSSGTGNVQGIVLGDHLYINSTELQIKLSVGTWLTDGQNRNRVYTNNTNPSSDFIFNLGQSNGLFSWRPYNSSTPIASLDYAGNLAVASNLTANTGNIGDVRIGATGMIYPNLETNVAAGMYGNYVSTRVGHIWSMGTGFKIADNGSGLGNLYGLAYRYKETGGGGGKDFGHSILFVGNGAVSTQIGLINGHIWTAGNIYVDLSVAASVKVSAPTVQATDKLLIPTAPPSSLANGEACFYIGNLSGITN